MHPKKLALVAALFISACASAPPRLTQPTKNSPSVKAAPTAAVPADQNLSGLPNPFASKADEEMFWRVVNGEIPPEPSSDELHLARAVRVLLSSLTPEQFRGKVLLTVMQNAPMILLTNKEGEKIAAELYSGDPANRWHALQLLLESDLRLVNMLRYVMNDMPRIKAFVLHDADEVAKAKAEMEKNQSEPSIDPDDEGGPAPPNAPPPPKIK